MRTVGGVTALVLGALAAIAAGVAALLLAGYSWSQVAGYQSPYLRTPLPAARASAPLTGRVVVVIADGLRADTSRTMTALELLRQHGTDATLTASQPSLSHPGWTAILSGAPQTISGVTTNSSRKRVGVETLLDTAIATGAKTVVVGPWALETLYGARRADGHYLKDYPKGKRPYLSTDLVLHTMELVKAKKPTFVLLHLPDIDEAGHEYGAASKEYLDTAMRVDTDLSVLVRGLQDANTTFVVVSDHGHTDTGGHGGWEPEVVQVPAVIAGSGVALGRSKGRLEDLAPTVAAIGGFPTPRRSVGRILPGVLVTGAEDARRAQRAELDLMLQNVLSVLEGKPAAAQPSRSFAGMSERAARHVVATASSARAARESAERLPFALAICVAALLAVAAVGGLSWRALVSALAGTLVYYGVYDGLFFGVHRLAWSLSSFNTEDRVPSYLATRMGEAALAGLLAVLVAALVYPLLRREPKGAWGQYVGGWLALAPAVVLVAQATLALQVAWYLWRWGARISWVIPDLGWGFKYDLDLVQIGALAAVALLGPVVTLLVGRYHPSVVRPEGLGAGPPLTDNERVLPRAAEE